LVHKSSLELGSDADATTTWSNKGLGANFAISYSQGLFGGLTVEVSKNKTRLMFFNRNVMTYV
jgi:lipid-binding SYLF domain-containing protein